MPGSNYLPGNVGHRSIVDKSSAYGAKGPGFKTWWRQDLYCMFCSFEKIKLRLGPTLKKNTYWARKQLTNCLLFRSSLEKQTKIVQCSDHHLNNTPFDQRAIFYHSNTRLVWYSDPHCTEIIFLMVRPIKIWTEEFKMACDILIMYQHKKRAAKSNEINFK